MATRAAVIGGTMYIGQWQNTTSKLKELDYHRSQETVPRLMHSYGTDASVE